jgi:heat shock protein HslJ
MKRTLSLALALAIAALAAFTAGCGAKADTEDLSANPWVVTYLPASDGLTTVLEGTSPAIYFRTDGTVVGNASVNAFQGEYTVTGRSIQIGPLVRTEWGGPQQEIAQENTLIEALESAQHYAVAGDELVLYAASNDPVMRLAIASEPQLVGALWLCTECAGDDGALTAVTGTSPIGAEFDPDGRLGGTGGVSEFETTYAIEGEKMSVGPEFTTSDASGPPEMEAQEARYFDALKRVASFQIDEYQLTLMDASGARIAVHVPLAPKQ